MKCNFFYSFLNLQNAHNEGFHLLFIGMVMDPPYYPFLIEENRIYLGLIKIVILSNLIESNNIFFLIKDDKYNKIILILTFKDILINEIILNII